MMKLTTPLVLLFALFGTAAASGGSCACEAEELGYKIDCSDTATMLAALDFLNANGCGSNCSSEECEKNYYIVQAHHDFCPEADIPEAIEDGFHDFDEVCTQCGITRSFVEGAPDCPAANCADTSGNDAYTALVENGCNADCASDTCRDLFFVLRIVHDTCDHDVLSRAAEEGLHDLERPCAAQICNDPNGMASQLICSDEDHHDHDDHGDCHCDADGSGGFEVHCTDPAEESHCHCHDGEAHCDDHDEDHDDEMSNTSKSGESGAASFGFLGSVAAGALVAVAL